MSDGGDCRDLAVLLQLQVLREAGGESKGQQQDVDGVHQAFILPWYADITQFDKHKKYAEYRYGSGQFTESHELSSYSLQIGT